jgi:hypothetical protein
MDSIPSITLPRSFHCPNEDIWSPPFLAHRRPNPHRPTTVEVHGEDRLRPLFVVRQPQWAPWYYSTSPTSVEPLPPFELDVGPAPSLPHHLLSPVTFPSVPSSSTSSRGEFWHPKNASRHELWWALSPASPMVHDGPWVISVRLVHGSMCSVHDNFP